jgi:CheY-like chemotaxis protein
VTTTVDRERTASWAIGEKEAPSRKKPARRELVVARCALVVDDEWLLVDYARTILEELGCEVLTATCGSDALHALSLNQHIDLLLTDVQMPDMNGLELIERAKRQRPSLHVIVTSGHAEVPEGVPFVRKPFTRWDLVRVIERAPERTDRNRVR